MGQQPAPFNGGFGKPYTVDQLPSAVTANDDEEAAIKLATSPSLNILFIVFFLEYKKG